MMTETQIKQTVANLQNMLSRLPTQKNRNNHLKGSRSGNNNNNSLSQKFQLYIPNEPDLSTLGVSQAQLDAERLARLRKERARELLLELH